LSDYRLFCCSQHSDIGAGEAAMATINRYKAKDGSISYRVRIQRKGYPTQSATFGTVKECHRWATMIEGQIIAGRHFPEKKPTYTLAELIEGAFGDSYGPQMISL
jgi:hypothetical protein